MGLMLDRAIKSHFFFLHYECERFIREGDVRSLHLGSSMRKAPFPCQVALHMRLTFH